MPRCCKGTQGSTARQEAPAGTEMCENRKSLDQRQYMPDEAGSVSRERFPNCQHHPPRSSTRAPNIGEYTVHHPLPTHAAANPTTSAAPPHLTLLRMAVRIRVVKTLRLRRHGRRRPRTPDTPPPPKARCGRTRTRRLRRARPRRRVPVCAGPIEPNRAKRITTPAGRRCGAARRRAWCWGDPGRGP